MKIHEQYGLTEEQYQDIIKPYQILLKVILENQVGNIVLKTPEEVLEELKKAEKSVSDNV